MKRKKVKILVYFSPVFQGYKWADYDHDCISAPAYKTGRIAKREARRFWHQFGVEVEFVE